MNLELIKDFRKKLADGWVLGPFMKTCDPGFVESAGYAGMDFAILDMEHGPISVEHLQNNIRAAQVSGLLPVVRVNSYEEISRALDRTDYFSAANQALVIVQLEGQEAIRNLDEIMEVEGIDIMFIGPYDLSQSLEVPGQTTHPLVVQQMKKIVDKAREKNILVGTFTDSLETLKMWSDAGVRYLSYSVDMGIFYEACTKIRKRMESMNC